MSENVRKKEKERESTHRVCVCVYGGGQRRPHETENTLKECRTPREGATSEFNLFTIVLKIHIHTHM